MEQTPIVTRLSDKLESSQYPNGWIWIEYKHNNYGLGVYQHELANIPQVKAVLDLLDELQFPEYYPCDNACAICGNFEFAGHEPDCKLKLALDAFKCLPDDKETK